MNNPTIIQNPIYINGKDDNGCQYPNIDIRYGPYNSINEAIDILTKNDWFIPFLTIGVKDDNIIKEYWINENKQLVDKSLNYIINFEGTKTHIIDYINNNIENINNDIIEIHNILKDYKDSFSKIFDSIYKGIPNDINNCLDKIKNNKNDINIIRNNINDIYIKLKDFKEIFNSEINNINNKIFTKFDNVNFRITNINKVLESITEEQDDIKIKYNKIIEQVNENNNLLKTIINKIENLNIISKNNNV